MEAQREELEKETYRLKHELVSTQMKLESARDELAQAKAKGEPDKSRAKKQ